MSGAGLRGDRTNLYTLPSLAASIFAACCAAPPSSLAGVADQLGLSSAAFRWWKTGGGRGRRKGEEVEASWQWNLASLHLEPSRLEETRSLPLSSSMREGNPSASRRRESDRLKRLFPPTIENISIRVNMFGDRDDHSFFSHG